MTGRKHMKHISLDPQLKLITVFVFFAFVSVAILSVRALKHDSNESNRCNICSKYNNIENSKFMYPEVETVGRFRKKENGHWHYYNIFKMEDDTKFARFQGTNENRLHEQGVVTAIAIPAQTVYRRKYLASQDFYLSTDKKGVPQHD